MDALTEGARKLGIDLTPDQLARFDLYSRELLAWNRQFNLTGITDPEEVRTRHFLDSLTVAVLFKSGASRALDVLDVGSGAGFPGILLKLVFPEMRMTLVEATGKKARFLNHIKDALAMPDVRVLALRSEDVANDPKHRESYDLVLARALAPMSALAELTLPFCGIGGVVAAQKKGAIEEEMKEAAPVVATMGGRLRETIPVTLPELAGDERCLGVLEKVGLTPEAYPRRSGIPAKRPLAGARQP